ncbi:MAG: O-antigen polymerase [Caulobacteraceae bacterium]|nr:O-antigen polymerase [Caulobacteraceae bacterium]
MVDLNAEMAQLWNSLREQATGGPRAVQFIAARSGEGTSSVAREFARFAAQRTGRRVWLVDLDLAASPQYAAIEAEPGRYGALGPPMAATPDGSTFFTVQPPAQDWPDARYLIAHAVGGKTFWVTRFLTDAVRGRQTAQALPSDRYWTALRRHADLIVVDSPPIEASQDGLTVAPLMDQTVLVVGAGQAKARSSVDLRDAVAEAGGHCAGVFLNRIRSAPGRATSTAPPPTRPGWGQVAIFGLALFVLLTFTQGWLMPIFGEKGDRFQPILRLAFLPAYAAGFALFATTPLRTLNGLLRQPFLIALVAIALISVFWSINPSETSRRGFFLFCTTLAGVTLGARFGWRTLAEVTATTFLIVTVASLVVSAAVPSIGRMVIDFPGAWRGLWPDKNALGGNMALAFAALVAAGILVRERRWLWWSGAVLAVFLVLMSTSKTSLVALMLGGGMIGFVAIIRRGPVMAVLSGWAAVLLIGLAAGVAVFAADAVFGVLGKDATLTGRTEIWSAVMRQIHQRPWTGFGYQAVWENKDPASPLGFIIKQAGFEPHHAHNSWLEQWLGMGVWGLATFALYYAQTAIMTLVAVFRREGAYLVAPYFMIYSMMTLTESIAVGYNDFRWVLLVAFSTKLALSAFSPAEGRAPGPARLIGSVNRVGTPSF